MLNCGEVGHVEFRTGECLVGTKCQRSLYLRHVACVIICNDVARPAMPHSEAFLAFNGPLHTQDAQQVPMSRERHKANMAERQQHPLVAGRCAPIYANKSFNQSTGLRAVNRQKPSRRSKQHKDE